MHTDPTTCAARTQHKSALEVLFCVLFAIGAAKEHLPRMKTTQALRMLLLETPKYRSHQIST